MPAHSWPGCHVGVDSAMLKVGLTAPSGQVSFVPSEPGPQTHNRTCCLEASSNHCSVGGGCPQGTSTLSHEIRIIWGSPCIQPPSVSTWVLSAARPRGSCGPAPIPSCFGGVCPHHCHRRAGQQAPQWPAQAPGISEATENPLGRSGKPDLKSWFWGEVR